MLDTRRILKIFHELSSAGIIGALAAHLVLLSIASTTEALEYATVRRGIEAITRLVLLPSLGTVLFTGLIAIAVHRPFHGAGWAWVKLASGLVMFEGTLGAINGTARDAASLSARVARGELPVSAMDDVLRHEWGGLWVILFLSVANIVLGVWRPRLTRRKPDEPPVTESPASEERPS
jgi:hypothetical protein